MPTPWKLSPSDLTFLWDECPRCFYLKVVHKFNRPASPFPSIFGKIDLLMKTFFEGKSTQAMHPGLPPGKVLYGEKWVESQPISLPGRSAQAFLRGKFDTVVGFEDGSYGVIDFKTSTPKPEHVEFYGRQLHAYAHALENPAAGKFALAPISVLGLVVLEPVDLVEDPTGNGIFKNRLTWVPVPRDDAAFFHFMDLILSVLEQPEPPAPNEDCVWCKYRQQVRAYPSF